MDQYIIEYTGIVCGKSYDFQTFEGELPRSEQSAAQEILEHAGGEFVQQIRVTKINIGEGTAYDVTEDITNLCGELFVFEWSQDDDGGEPYATNVPNFLEQYGHDMEFEI